MIGSTVAAVFCALGLFGLDLFLASSVVALINAIISTNVGARFYTEEA